MGLQTPLQHWRLSPVQATPLQQVPSFGMQTPLQQMSSELTQHLKGPPQGRSVPAPQTSEGGGSQSAWVAPQRPSPQQTGVCAPQQLSPHRVPPVGHWSHWGLDEGQQVLPLRVGAASGQHCVGPAQTMPGSQPPPLGQHTFPEGMHLPAQHWLPEAQAPAPQQTVPAGSQLLPQQTSEEPQQPPPHLLVQLVPPLPPVLPPVPPPPELTLAHQLATVCAAASQLLHPLAQLTFEAPVRVYQQVQAPPPVGQLVQAPIDLPVPQLAVWEQVVPATAELHDPTAATTASIETNPRAEDMVAPEAGCVPLR